MLRLFTILLAITFSASAPAQYKLSIDLGVQYNGTVYDRTMRNNINGGGVTLLGRLRNDDSRIAPFLDVTADVFGGTRELALINGRPVDTKKGVIGIYGGAAWYPLRRLFTSLAIGPTFITSGTYIGIKPSIGYHLGRNHGFTTCLSLTNVFERNADGNEDFGFISFGVAFRVL